MKVLVLGGSRSGKSEVAERLVGRPDDPVTYVATYTASGQVTDPDMARRIEEHRRRRPPGWSTVEADEDLVDVLAGADGPVLVDSLGTWVAAEADFRVDVQGLCAVIAARSDPTVIVSDEVGMSVHPETEVGRRFRDVLGDVNQRVAEVVDRTVLVVAGRVLTLAEPDSWVEGD